MQSLLESIERLSERLAVSLKIQSKAHEINLFLLEAPYFSKTPDGWQKSKLITPTSNLILRIVDRGVVV